MTDAKRTGATIQWAEFTAETTTLLRVLALMVEFKRNFPVLLEALPDLVEELAGRAGPEISQERIAELRSRAATLKNADTTELPASFERVCCEIAVSRIVDQFELYLTRLLARILRSYPKALGDTQIPVRELLESGDMQEAIDRTIEEKVHQLSFAGMSGIADFMEKQFGILLDRKAQYFMTVSEVIEVRHLIVHHGGLVSRRFLANTTRADLKPGMPFPIGWQWVLDATRSFAMLSDEWDRQVYARLPKQGQKPTS